MVASWSRRLAAALTVGALLAAVLGVVPARALGFLFVVNSSADTVDTNIPDPACEDAFGHCSLRAAVIQANFLDPDGGHHTIRLPAGAFTLDIENTAGTEYAAFQGDLNILQDMHIEGAGAGKTFIQASPTGYATGIDRVFDLRGDGVDVELKGLTVRYGNSHTAAGGGILIPGSNRSLVLSGVIVEQNSAAVNSGAAIQARGRLTINDSIIRNNHGAQATIEVGNKSEMTIERSTISGNVTTGSAAFRLGDDVGAFVNRSTISGNKGLNGTVIELGRSDTDLAQLRVINSTFSGNSALDEVIYGHANSQLVIEASTIAGNTGRGLGSSGSAIVKNTIFSSNSEGNCLSPVTSAGHNLETGTSCGFTEAGDIQNGHALLAALASNGGPTKTRALGKDSDAIDAGSGCPATDQRGSSRPKDGDGDGTATCDIGAYEHAKVALVTPSPTLAPTAPPTPEPTVEVTAAPTAAPTEAPTVAPAPTEPPAASEPAASAATATSGAGDPTPGATAQPVPIGTAGGIDTTLVIVLVIVAVVVGLLFGFGLRRRRPPPSASGG